MAFQESMVGGYQVLSDGMRIWVNGPDGSSVARFSAVGIDVHNPVSEQAEKGECLNCQHAPMDEAGWQAFLASLKEHFNLVIPDRFKPEWLLPLDGSDRRQRAHDSADRIRAIIRGR